MAIEMPPSDLSRAKTNEREQDWPDDLRIVAKWGQKTRTVVLTADEFFGRGIHGAPMTADSLFHRINTLRKSKP